MRNPGWSAVSDIDGPKAIETRRKLYDMAVAEKSLIAGFHYPFPSLGHAEKDGTSYRLVPIAWNRSIWAMRHRTVSDIARVRAVPLGGGLTRPDTDS